jgi:hypothetical protein
MEVLLDIGKEEASGKDSQKKKKKNPRHQIQVRGNYTTPQA